MTHLTGFPVKPEISHQPYCSKAAPRLQERGSDNLGRGGVDLQIISHFSRIFG